MQIKLRRIVLGSGLILVAIIAMIGIAQSGTPGGPIAELRNMVQDISNNLTSLIVNVNNIDKRVNVLEATSGGEAASFFDVFIKIGDIKGEATDEKHKDWIDVESFSWGMTNSGTTHVGGGAGAGKVEVHDFSFVKKIDKSSPVLFLHCANGKHIPDTTIDICRAGGDKQCYMKYELKDAIVSSCNVAGNTNSGNDKPIESLSLNFAKIKWTYTPSPQETPISGGWDVAKNEEI